MDLTPLISEFYKIILFVVFIALLMGIFKSPRGKGIFGEAMVRLLSMLMLNKNIYRPFHDVTLPSPDGSTQIDHVYVSPYGIFVVETKNMRGWIFGDARQSQWTQKIYKKSFKFQNPLRQNFKHVKALESVLQVPAGTIHSIVTFVGDSSFKTPMPPNVTYGAGFIRHIKSFKEKVFSEDQVSDLVARIESGRLQPGYSTRKKHVQRLKERSNRDQG
ncbi:nuclease-related domain-containing protein [Desulfonatronovibrio hydrogenovorans]|uniref:nuclease-related domain-containing protein n=1 Tax=Desulfonatronovibrio hydrogenovorans TaxID=53245 RepID=UPI00048DEDC1|nr:nuclease-related domain-containing protein [Desulfonatronovibrio hydrogenovorans]